MKIKNGTISHIEIYVSDLEKSTQFWAWLLTQKLDYQEFQKWEQGVSYLHDETYIVLVQTESDFLSQPYHRKNTGLNHIAFYCTTRSFVDELAQELKAKGVRVLYEEKKALLAQQGTYAVFFEDPDGIKIEVVAIA